MTSESYRFIYYFKIYDSFKRVYILDFMATLTPSNVRKTGQSCQIVLMQILILHHALSVPKSAITLLGVFLPGHGKKAYILTQNNNIATDVFNTNMRLI